MASVYCIILLTAPDKKTADELSEGLVQRKLAACVNIVPSVFSVYWWDQKIERADEFLLLVKTRRSLFPEITEFVKRTHPHSVPEALMLDIRDGHEPYLHWLGSHTLFTGPRDENLGRRADP